MRLSLQTHPKVVRILSATKSDKFRVVGGLHAVWSVFDTHSVDGRLDGYNSSALDHIIGWEGFSDALIAVGWLVCDGSDSLVLPEFDEHNGASGKRRAEDQKRKRDSRKSPKVVPQEIGQKADKKRTESGLEKRREEKSKEVDIYVEQFDQAMTAYPKRAGGNSRAEAKKAWDARLKAGADPGDMIDGVIRYRAFCEATQKVGTEYVKQAATFFGPSEFWKEAWAAPVKTTTGGRHAGFEQQDYRAGVGDDGSF